MHSTARRAGELWRRNSHGITKRCTFSTCSSNGFVKKDVCEKPTKADGNSSYENSLDDAIGDKFGAHAIHKPPLQSLHKAVLAGEVTLPPSQKVRKNGKVVTTFLVATGGMWRLPIPSKKVALEDDCTDPCLQHHKVAVHDEELGKLAVRTLRRGMQVYVEGELETRVFNHGETGAVKRDREIAVHATGQIMTWTEKGPVSLEQQ